MDKMIAYCGYTCSECLAFKATQSDDDTERIKIAEMWSKQFDADIKPESINCDGCASGSDRIFDYCNICEIRKCAIGKQVINCAYCVDYSCEKLDTLFKMAPNAKSTLEEIRKNI